MKIKTILVDLDNTMLDTAKGIVENCRSRYPKLNIPEYGTVPLDWKFSNYNLPEDYWQLFGSNKTYKEEYIYKDCREALFKLKEKGYKILVCTRSNLGLDKKKAFIRQYFPMVDGVIFVSTKEFEDKDLISNDRETILIDDKVECIKNRELGILFGDYEWNRESRESGNYLIADNWEEVLENIELLEKYNEDYEEKN